VSHEPPLPNDGRFPDGARVFVRYPPDCEIRSTGPGSLSDRESWPWLPGVIDHQSGPEEWAVTIVARSHAVLADGSPAAESAPDDALYFAHECFRESSEIRLAARLN
jgi:hypothetical protein